MTHAAAPASDRAHSPESIRSLQRVVCGDGIRRYIRAFVASRIDTMRITPIRLGYRQFFGRIQIIWRRNAFMRGALQR
ncbi:hypothetical protein BDI4_2260003 [Burkholderia diffusa]|nr:hypothetical protein BDI4_2260003 [Burkholderia diffusa]